jgi:putative ABC transport system ATP-binding protein
MPDQENIIQLVALHKIFTMGTQQVRAVDDLNLDLPAGSFTMIQGPSGSGKSTLLYMIGGLDTPTSGSIIVHGRDLSGLDENELAFYRREQVGYIFQSFNLISSMTAMENVAFPLRFSGIPPRERKERALQMLELVGLADRAEHRPTELSGGQQQRVAVARALINHPLLILADEPTGNLDSRSGFRLLNFLKTLNEQGTTIIMVSHDPRLTHYASDLIFLLDGKRVSEAEFNASNQMLEMMNEEN